jgi:hypothetical protein
MRLRESHLEVLTAVQDYLLATDKAGQDGESRIMDHAPPMAHAAICQDHRLEALLEKIDCALQNAAVRVDPSEVKLLDLMCFCVTKKIRTQAGIDWFLKNNAWICE